MSRFANVVYYPDHSKTRQMHNLHDEFYSKRIVSKTALYMEIFRSKVSPAYHVIAIRGTVAASDYFYDNLRHTVGFEGISEYQKDAFASVKELLEKDNSRLPVILTGHSMGGKIAEMLLAQFYVGYVQSQGIKKSKALRLLSTIIGAYAYDSPGTFPLIEEYFKHEFPENYLEVLHDFLKLRHKRVYDIVGHPNSVNMCHKHTGHVYYLPKYGRFSHVSLEQMVLQDFTKDLVAKHSMEDMMIALGRGEELVKVGCWGGVSAIEQESSIRRLNNFFCSYHEHMEQQARTDPTWKNYFAAGSSKFMFGAVTRSQVTPSHPLVKSAQKVDKQLARPRLIQQCESFLRTIGIMN